MRPRYRFIQLMDRWSSLVNARWPRGIGTAGTVAVILASLAYGSVKGDHIPTVVEAFKDVRDAAANAAGFRIVSVALAGQHHISREDVLAAAGGWTRRRDARKGVSCVARPLSGPARLRARHGPGGRAPLEPAAEERHRRAAPGNRHCASAGAAGRARQGKDPVHARYRRHRSQAPRSRDGAALRGCRAGAHRCGQGQGQEEGGQRMSTLQFGLTPKMKPLTANRSVLVAALDVGTSKIACLIGRLKPRPTQDVLRLRTHSVDVIGFGHTLARGMKAGTVIDLAEAEAAVRQCADLAERTARMQLDSVIVSVSAGRPTSELISASIEIAGAAISERDIDRVLTAGSRHSARAGRAVLHSLPIGYVLDHARGVRDPRGMLAREFGIDMHVVTADGSAARNLMLAVERCHLAVEAMVTSPYVAGLSALADDEAELGAAVIEMGAGTTTIAVFSSGRFVHA